MAPRVAPETHALHLPRRPTLKSPAVYGFPPIAFAGRRQRKFQAQGWHNKKLQRSPYAAHHAEMHYVQRKFELQRRLRRSQFQELIPIGRDQRNGIKQNVMDEGSRMARKRDTTFFECPDCQKATLLSDTPSENICPRCGSPSGRVISSAELERRIEDLASILRPSGCDKPKRQ